MTVTNEGRRWWAAGLVALTLLLGACSSRQSSAPITLESPAAPPSPEQQASAAPTAPVAAGVVDFCEAIKAEFELVPQLLDPATERDAARRRTLLAEAKQANDKIIATAPKDQKRDVQIVIGASNAANASLASTGTVSPEAMKEFETADYRDASARVRTFVQNQCHIDMGTAAKPTP